MGVTPAGTLQADYVPSSSWKAEAVALKNIYFISVPCCGSKQFSLL